MNSSPWGKGVRESFAGKGGRAQGVDIRWFRQGFPVGLGNLGGADPDGKDSYKNFLSAPARPVNTRVPPH